MEGSVLGNRTVRVLIRGGVFHAGLRSCIQRQATRLALRGYVRARPDRCLEVLAAGSADNLTRLLQVLRDAPGADGFERVDVDWTDQAVPEGRFTISYGDW
ncbi:MAG: acylphosphatase [bacterium]|nr:acylphosphatase [bacterium]